MNDEVVPSSSVPNDPPLIPAPLPVTASPGPAAPTLFCVSHRKVPAVYRCDRCGSCVCNVCVFELPGSRHLCPSCTSAGSKTFSRGRSRSVYWSLALGSLSTVSLVLLMFVIAAAVMESGGQFLFGVLLNLFVLFPSMLGLAFAWGAHEKRLANPALLWVGLFWNAAVAAVFFLLVVIGLFSGN